LVGLFNISVIVVIVVVVNLTIYLFSPFSESPVPIMLGVLKLPPDFVLLEGYVVVDPQERTVHLHPTDVVQSHTTLLPNASRLIAALRPSADKILQLSRKRKSQQQKVTITVQHEKVVLSTTPLLSTINAQRMSSLNVSDLNGYQPGSSGSQLKSPAERHESASGNPKNSPAISSPVVPSRILPLALDIPSEDCIAFSGAIMQFSGLVSNHILAILNTGIQLQQQAKELARAKRRVVQSAIVKPTQKKPETIPGTPPPLTPSPPPKYIEKQVSQSILGGRKYMPLILLP
jgi:hypothetical protein